jgi:hypothetical protein
MAMPSSLENYHKAIAGPLAFSGLVAGMRIDAAMPARGATGTDGRSMGVTLLYT